jgi:hypothetical protein
MQRSIFACLSILSSLFGALGCGAADEDGAPEDISSQQEAAATTSFATDSTGTISVSYTRCDPTTSRGIRISFCKVHPDYVLVGGGAEVVDSPQPGALLTSSSPDSQNQRWVAIAKDHNETQTYSLRAHAIGLKLSGVSRDALREMVRVDSHSIRDIPGGTVLASMMLPHEPPGSPSRVVIGGGVDSISRFANEGRLLVASAPLCNDDPRDTCLDGTRITGWAGISKDHFTPASGDLHTYLISIPECPPGYTRGCLKNELSWAGSDLTTGYQSVFVESIAPVTGVGALVEFSAPGRLLTDLFPNRRSSSRVRVYAESKDHQRTAFGHTRAYALRLLPRGF